MSEPRPAPDPMRRFFGWLLWLVGLLMMTLCGLCTLVSMALGATSSGGAMVAALSIVIGGIPTAIGFGLFTAGRALLRPPPPDPQAFD